VTNGPYIHVRLGALKLLLGHNSFSGEGFFPEVPPGGLTSVSPNMEPTTGIEPVNLFLTKEVLYLLSYVGPGAGNGTRTRNPQLGRLML
jgi:hypothetical protein